jgi:hypothetical protein
MPITTTPSGGPQGEFSTYTPIYSQTLSSATASVTFSNIPTTFTDLRIVANTRSSRNSLWDSLSIRYNLDSSSVYSETYVQGNSSSGATSGRESNSSAVFNGNFPSATSPSGVFGTITVDVMNYSNPNVNKTSLIRGNAALDGSNGNVDAIVSLYRGSAAPITSITLFSQTSSNFVSGSTFTLYGIKAAAPAPKATGGDVITTDGTYWYHAFKNSGLFDVKTSVNADILVVAGGGGGGYGSQVVGAPGGAGGLQYLSSQSLTAIPYAVTVGAGAAGRVIDGGINFDGSNSQFGSLTASVGGGGGGYDPFALPGGRTGGSGGGGAPGYPDPARSPGTGGTASPAGQGNAGGNGATSGSASWGAGGGGGAGGVGGNATSSSSGNGGVGLTNSNINAFGAATATGQLVSGSYYYAGGGGGGGTVNSAGGTGGHGGGGSGAFNSNASPSGTVNTGGGGGGGANATGGTNRPGGSGGSGIIIVRYPV